MDTALAITAVTNPAGQAVTRAVEQVNHWIGGGPCRPASGRYLDPTSPRGYTLLPRIADGTAAHRAVIAEHQAQQD